MVYIGDAQILFLCATYYGYLKNTWYWSNLRSNLIEICQRPEGCNLTVTVLGSQLSGIFLDHRIGKGSVHLAK